MNLFWQITLIELLLNVAIFAGAIIIYGPVRQFARGLLGDRDYVESSASGLLFGLATASALLLPIHLAGSGAVGAAAILLALAGPLDGYWAILLSVVSSVGIVLLPWVPKEQPTQEVIFSLLVSASIGLIFNGALQYWPGHRKSQFNYLHLPLLGMLTALGGLCVLAFSQGAADVASSIIPAMVSNISAVVILGTLLLHEKGRSATERALRESEAHLALQARELAGARDNADSANRAKSMFLANMSHELRTPLNAILGYVQLLKRGPGSTKWHMDACNTIQQSGEHLLTLISDILDLAKIEAGKCELKLDPVDLMSFLLGVVNIIRVKGTEKSLDVGCHIARNLPVSVRIDQQRLRQVLLNLLSNAVKFTARGRVDLQVRVLTESKGQVRLYFTVRDTGSGIARNNFEKIFRPFEQLDGEQQSIGGTGLGLTISRQLVRLMGGEIKVESALGQGSSFSFDIPAAVVEDERAVSHLSRLATGYEGRRKRLLVVDDTDANRMVLSDILKRLGFEVDQAANGVEALSLAQAAPPDLIFMDVKMPVMGGLEAIHRMQQIPDLCMVPVVAVSAGVTQDEQDACLTAGAKAFLTKPIDEAVMLREIGALLDLQWIYESQQPKPAVMGVGGEQFVLPEPVQMEALHKLAKRGNMRAIVEKADHLAVLNAECRPFADRIVQLALGYQSKALLRLVEKHAARQQEGHEGDS
jgi:signal transduction histidine kinase/ActR/RegA family two-component response regulator